MCRHTLDREKGAAGIEGFVDDFTQRAAVDRVSEIDGKLRNVELLRTTKPDFFVRHESNVDLAMRSIFFAHDCKCRHQVGNRGFVVGA